MIEPSRRHGHFDPRFSIRLPAPRDASTSYRAGSIGLRSRAVSSRAGARHDFEVLKAFEAYKNGSSRPTEGPPRDREPALVLVRAG